MQQSLLIIIIFLFGLLSERYILPAFDLIFDVFRYKQTDKATEINLETQSKTLEFAREYPEVNQNQGIADAIGYKYQSSSSDEEQQYEEDYEYEDRCGVVGFVNYQPLVEVVASKA